MRNVYITSAGKFLPNEPIGNDLIEDYLGLEQRGGSWGLRPRLREQKWTEPGARSEDAMKPREVRPRRRHQGRHTPHPSHTSPGHTLPPSSHNTPPGSLWESQAAGSIPAASK
jgi:hypothetical protein